MNLILNEKTLNYLKKLKLSENIIILVTDLDKVIFSNKKDYIDIYSPITRELLVTLLQSNIGVTQKNNKDIINISDNISKTIKFISEIIFPIKSYGECYGSIILLNMKNEMDMIAVEFLHTVKKNIEFYLEKEDVKEIKKYEYNPLYNKQYISTINQLVDSYIYDLIIDKNYKNIINLLYYKIDTLETDLKPHNIDLLNEIIELFEQKKELHTVYGAVIGTKFHKILNLKQK